MQYETSYDTNQLPTPALPGSGLRDKRIAQSQPETQRPCVRLFYSTFTIALLFLQVNIF